ncbi:MAG: universal stress protein [Rhodospirillales bacterium]|jgi:nucleotide-binding universal stress UspA family protein|nr:universal stress protein [Rhodospirillales bacterium]
MAIRKILVPVDGSEAARTALKTALIVGRAQGAHVEALHVKLSAADAVPLIGEGMSGAFAEELMELTRREADLRAVAARQTFDQCRGELDVPRAEAPIHGEVTTAFIETIGREDDETAHRGRLADLIVVARPSTGSDVTADLTLNAALYESGRPVLVAPAELRPVIGRRIAVAWNDSAEAARALAGAIPLLTTADQVWVVTADGGGDGEASCRDAVAYLGYHGVAAETRVVLGARAVGDALLDGCAEADLVVMGAYTHSRLRELILGGTTRYMLEESTLPLLMAH